MILNSGITTLKVTRYEAKQTVSMMIAKSGRLLSVLKEKMFFKINVRKTFKLNISIFLRHTIWGATLTT